MRSIALLGAPSSAGANAGGLERAPAHLRQCGLNLQLISRGATITDYGDGREFIYAPDDHASARGLAAATQAARDVQDHCRALLKQESVILLLGGDCTVSLGLVAAASEVYDRLGLVYMDSQTDLNTPDTTDTGILDSMGLAHLIGCTSNTLSKLGTNFPIIAPELVTAFGYHPERITPAEHQVLDATPIRRYPATEISGAVADAAEAALADIAARCDAFILHFDVDVIDFTAFPVADAPVYRGFGLKFDEALAALAVFTSSEKCVGLAVTEFNPDRDRDQKLGRQFVDALASALVPGSADAPVRRTASSG